MATGSEGAMIPVYEGHGLRFFYPEGWSVVDEGPSDQVTSITVHSANGAFWSVSAYEGPIAPAQLLAQTVETMKQEYDSMEASAIEQQVGEHPAHGYEMHFFYLDLLITARVLAWRQGRRALLVMCQAENREFDELAMVFAAMSTSLERELGR